MIGWRRRPGSDPPITDNEHRMWWSPHSLLLSRLSFEKDFDGNEADTKTGRMISHLDSYSDHHPDMQETWQRNIQVVCNRMEGCHKYVA